MKVVVGFAIILAKQNLIHAEIECARFLKHATKDVSEVYVKHKKLERCKFGYIYVVVATDAGYKESSKWCKIIKKQLFKDPKFLLYEEEHVRKSFSKMYAASLQTARFIKYILDGEIMTIPGLYLTYGELDMNIKDMKMWTKRISKKEKYRWNLFWQVNVG